VRKKQAIVKKQVIVKAGNRKGQLLTIKIIGFGNTIFMLIIFIVSFYI